MSMPCVDKYDFQSPMEVARQLVHYGGPVNPSQDNPVNSSRMHRVDWLLKYALHNLSCMLLYLY